jgi:hypothetical protein
MVPSHPAALGPARADSHHLSRMAERRPHPEQDICKFDSERLAKLKSEQSSRLWVTFLFVTLRTTILVRAGGSVPCSGGLAGAEGRRPGWGR